jgi:hypothetical protein
VNGFYSNSACSADLRRDANDISTIRQIAAHVGGMLCAVMRHYPINWKFHCRGICRAICLTLWPRPKAREKSGASPITLNTHTLQGTHYMKTTTTIDLPPILRSPKFRSSPDKLTTRKQRKGHHKKLFIPLHTFEVLDFPVRVRHIESLGNEVHLGGVRLITIKKGKPNGCYA